MPQGKCCQNRNQASAADRGDYECPWPTLSYSAVHVGVHDASDMAQMGIKCPRPTSGNTIVRGVHNKGAVCLDTARRRWPKQEWSVRG
jgi:hypothetical protein